MIKKFDSIKGFLDLNEGIALYEEVKRISENNFCVEIGSYCGKSTCFIGQACKENKSKLITIDHHKGSEEQQLGELYFDAEVYDEKLGRVNTLPLLEKNLAKFDLEDVVKPLVMDSISASKIVENNADLIFIDGSHTFESAESDYELWKNKIKKGGTLAIHDVYDSEDEGGQAPNKIFKQSLNEGFNFMKRVKSLVLLQKSN
ncbi:class I SAM-dependent methyltransferase [SAR86 cluster bacterium]|nr:class I SAM-dependent methyltransferase [SAR86 cluster bacterium]